jgi:RNA polymerase sigma-70 factor (ECF subfamily)
MLVASEELSDDRLLGDYVLSRNQESFAVLVRRYGPLVWGVCRRTAGHTHDAEDAFQATFAVLARKAASIRRRRSIGAWLHQVARRIALRVRTTSLRGKTAMDSLVTGLESRPSADAAAADRDEMLDDEIGRLPESLRLPIVMCYLQGLTNREAGERLGCPEGTIVSRLARARDLLRLRLVRRGIVLGSAAAVASLLTEAGSAAPLAPSLAQAALRCGLLSATRGAASGGILSAGAARLAEEMIGTLSRRSLLLRSGLLAGGIGSLALVVGIRGCIENTGTRRDAAGAGLNLALSGAPDQGLNPNIASATPLDGIWEGEDLEFVGGSDPAEHDQRSRLARWVVAAGMIRFKWQDQPLLAARFSADPSSHSGAIDYTITEGPQEMLLSSLPGLFEVRDQTLEVCSAAAGDDRPESIKTGLVDAPGDDAVTIRVGLAGYARLRRLDRSLEAEDLQGKWVLQQMEAGGQEMPIDRQGRQAAAFHDYRYVLYLVNNDAVLELGGTYTLDAAQPARFLEMHPEGGGDAMKCLYEIEGDTLRLCMAAPGGPRPAEFKTMPNQNHMSMRLKRATADGTLAPPGNSGLENQPNLENPKDEQKRSSNRPP